MAFTKGPPKSHIHLRDISRPSNFLFPLPSVRGLGKKASSPYFYGGRGLAAGLLQASCWAGSPPGGAGMWSALRKAMVGGTTHLLLEFFCVRIKARGRGRRPGGGRRCRTWPTGTRAPRATSSAARWVPGTDDEEGGEGGSTRNPTGVRSG